MFEIVEPIDESDTAETPAWVHDCSVDIHESKCWTDEKVRRPLLATAGQWHGEWGEGPNLFPLPDRPLSLLEKCVVIVAIHDRGYKGEKFIPQSPPATVPDDEQLWRCPQCTRPYRLRQDPEHLKGFKFRFDEPKLCPKCANNDRELVGVDLNRLVEIDPEQQQAVDDYATAWGQLSILMVFVDYAKDVDRRFIESAMRDVIATPAVAGETIAPADLAEMLAISAQSLLDYAKAAGVTTAKRGDRSFQYPAADVVKLCEYARQKLVNADSRKRCQKVISSIRETGRIALRP